MNDLMFSRNVPGITAVLKKAVVGIAGCGGIGSNAAIALTRAGIGKLILADNDIVELSNLNRQYFIRDDIGKKKVEALADHLRAVNPEICLDIHDCKLKPDTICSVFLKADILIEAFDQADDKQWCIEKWAQSFPQRPIIAGNGLAGYGNSDSIRVTRAGNIYFCGDLKSDMKMGLCAPRVAIVANMQANIVVELLMGEL